MCTRTRGSLWGLQRVRTKKWGSKNVSKNVTKDKKGTQLHALQCFIHEKQIAKKGLKGKEKDCGKKDDMARRGNRKTGRGFG